MANDLAVGGSTRGLANDALTAPSGQFSLTDMVRKYGGERVTDAKRLLQGQLNPLKVREPNFAGSECKQVTDSLRIIGMKVRPDLSADQCKAWCKATVIALSDLPTHIILQACSEAVHVPFQYLNQIEAEVRTRADRKLADHHMAIRRLDAMLQELRNARQPKLTDERGFDEPMPDAEVHALQRSPMGAALVRFGLRQGYIKPEQLLPLMEDDNDEQH